jgi:hypothetical protein
LNDKSTPKEKRSIGKTQVITEESNTNFTRVNREQEKVHQNAVISVNGSTCHITTAITLSTSPGIGNRDRK